MWGQALLLLLIAGIAGGAAIIAVIGALRGNHGVFARAGLAALVVSVGYGLLIIAVAAAAPDNTLPRGQEKYICELDCHLAYSVADVHRRSDSLFVRLKVRFDETTISRRRPRDVPVYPGPRRVELRGPNGERYPALTLGNLERTVLPGQSYETELVFDVDPGATRMVLYIADADPTKMVLVGSDNALFRQPVGFQL